jgi:hypothetical protein
MADFREMVRASLEAAREEAEEVPPPPAAALELLRSASFPVVRQPSTDRREAS